MNRKATYFLVILGLLGFLTLIPGVLERVTYAYFRLANGSEASVHGRCYRIPSGWILDSTGEHQGHGLFRVRGKINGSHHLVVVLVRAASSIPGLDSSSQGDMASPDSVFEMSDLDQSVNMRYWSSMSDRELIFIGSDASVVAEVAGLRWEDDC